MENKEKPETKVDPLLSKWNLIASYYSDTFSSLLVPTGVLLANLTGVEKADIVIDAACGDATIATELILRKKPKAKLYMNDFSQQMCRLAGLRLNRLNTIIKERKEILGFQNKIFDIKLDADLDLTPFEKNGRKYEALNTELHLCKNEELTHIEDGTVDSYVANLSLQIVPDPEKMLKECLRVLKKGGKAAFSVWGKNEGVNSFNIGEVVMEELGLDFSQKGQRTDWYLNDKKKLDKLLLDAGFTVVKSFYNFVPSVHMSQEHIEKASRKTLKLMPLPKEMHEDFIRLMKENIKKIDDENEMFGFSLLIAVVTK